MTDVIISEFKKVISKAIKKYAGDLKLPETSVQIVFSLNEKSENEYFIYADYKEKMKVTFKNLLGVLVDLFGRDVFVPPAINKILLKVNEDLKLDPGEVRLIFIKREAQEKAKIEASIDRFKEEQSLLMAKCNAEETEFIEKDPPSIDKDFRICIYDSKEYRKDIFYKEIFSLLEIA